MRLPSAAAIVCSEQTSDLRCRSKRGTSLLVKHRAIITLEADKTSRTHGFSP
jgi:hypothetical protein